MMYIVIKLLPSAIEITNSQLKSCVSEDVLYF